MRQFLLALSFITITVGHLGLASAQDALPRPTVELVPITAKPAQQRLIRSTHIADFFELANQFEPQMNDRATAVAPWT